MFEFVNVPIQIASFHSHFLELSLGPLYAHCISERHLERLLHHFI